ncbi:MAG: hypothetical protein WBD16_04685 [Pyrinomonadaceae bacterium]
MALSRKKKIIIGAVVGALPLILVTGIQGAQDDVRVATAINVARVVVDTARERSTSKTLTS